MKAQYLRYGRRVWTSLERVIASGHARERAFSDWINLTLDAYLSLTDNFARKGTNDPGDLDGPYEERYAATAAKYNREEMLALVQAYLDLAVAVDKHGVDVLGEIYTKCIHPSEGKYVTQQELVDHVAQLRLRAGMRVLDPCCGSGTMLIEAGKVADVELHGEDNDPVCARMCALNLLLFRFRGEVREGNSLGLKFVREWRIAKGQISEHEICAKAADQETRAVARDRPSKGHESDSSRIREARLQGDEGSGYEVLALHGRRRCELTHDAARR